MFQLSRSELKQGPGNMIHYFLVFFFPQSVLVTEEPLRSCLYLLLDVLFFPLDVCLK